MNKENKFYRVIKILLILLIGNSFPVFAQSGLEMSVSGFVRDVNSNAPIPGVEVIIFRLVQNSITDIFRGISNENGFYTVRYLETGDYEFYLDIPDEGLIYVFRNHSSDQRIMNLISIKDGININLDIFLGVDDEEIEYRDDSLDGTRICYNLIYKKFEEIQKSETTVNYNESQTQSSKIVEHNGLTIIFGAPEVIPDDQPLPGTSDPDAQGICDPSSIRLDYKQIMPFCDRRTVPERKKCDFDHKPKSKIIFEIKIFSKERMKMFYVNKYSNMCNNNDFTDSFIQCQHDCLIKHEQTHQELGANILMNFWDELWIKYKSTSCSCTKDCTDIINKLFVNFLKSFEDEYNKTEDNADEAQCECVTDKDSGCATLICKKDGVTYILKAGSTCKKNN
jgi:hypothetical protein